MAVKETIADSSASGDNQDEQKTTRYERGIALALEHFEEIRRVAPWRWSVPSSTGTGAYVVNLKDKTCPCADRTPEGETDKHVVAAMYVKAKTATCVGCGERFRHSELYCVPEGHLTFFEGDLLCEEDALNHGVL